MTSFSTRSPFSSPSQPSPSVFSYREKERKTSKYANLNVPELYRQFQKENSSSCTSSSAASSSSPSLHDHQHSHPNRPRLVSYPSPSPCPPSTLVPLSHILPARDLFFSTQPHAPLTQEMSDCLVPYMPLAGDETEAAAAATAAPFPVPEYEPTQETETADLSIESSLSHLPRISLPSQDQFAAIRARLRQRHNQNLTLNQTQPQPQPQRPRRPYVITTPIFDSCLVTLHYVHPSPDDKTDPDLLDNPCGGVMVKVHTGKIRRVCRWIKTAINEAAYCCWGICMQ